MKLSPFQVESDVVRRVKNERINPGGSYKDIVVAQFGLRRAMQILRKDKFNFRERYE